MWDFILERMRLFHQSCFNDKENTYTYVQIIDKVHANGAKLQINLQLGSKCGILCNSSMNTAIAILSCWCAGTIPILMSINYGEKHCKSIMELTNPDVIITDNTDSWDYGFVYHMDKQVFLGTKKEIQVEQELEGVSLIMCTSGTTGMPKGAMILAEGLQKNILAIADYFKITSDDKIMIARPLYHCAVLTGEFLISLYNGLNICFYDNNYSPATLISYAEQMKVTVLCGTPTLLNHVAYFVNRFQKPSSIKKIAISGECLLKEFACSIRRAFKDAEIYNVYGLTEASPRVSYLLPKYFDKIPESVGVPLNHTDCKIIDKESGVEQPVNIPGLLLVHSPSLMKGYYNNQEMTAYTIVDNWLNTHDIAYKDENGFLYILSRDDDMIIKAGMNIYPREIENAVSTINEIHECLVYGVKGELGENIAIDVVLREEYSDWDVKTLMQRFQGILPEYLMPTSVNIVKALARNASGKIIRQRKGK